MLRHRQRLPLLATIFIEAQRSFLLDVCEYPRVVIFGTASGGLSGKVAEKTAAVEVSTLARLAPRDRSGQKSRKAAQRRRKKRRGW